MKAANTNHLSLVASRLILENGFIFNGYSPTWQNGNYQGEVVFNTGMTGYPESLTDPSYNGQLLSFTYPLIGNYGVSDSNEWESHKIHARGVIVNDVCNHWSHFQGKENFLSWLYSQNIPLISGIDTRALTKMLRVHGSMLGYISCDESKELSYSDPNQNHLVAEVSIQQPKIIQDGSCTIIVVDCGIKKNILRSLAKYPIRIKLVPYNYDYTHEEYDGVLVSNGPGDPTQCLETIKILKKAMSKDKPIFGICLGTQLLALAAGGRTYKLKFGHRGHNQPCKEILTDRCFVTSQNHGFSVDRHSLPEDWKVSFVNLNDQSVEGIEHATKPFFSVQFHPEASPGPTDTAWLFDKFYELICESSKKGNEVLINT